MKIIGRIEREEISQARKIIMDSWKSDRSEPAQVSALTGLCIGYYLLFLLNAVESWQDEAIKLQGRVEQLEAQLPEVE